MTVERPAPSPAVAEKIGLPEAADEELSEQAGVRVWRWTRDDYYRASDMGLFGDQRVELLDGEILVMAGQKTPHFSTIRRVTDALEDLLGEVYEVRPQGPIVLSDDSEPEPDVVVVPGRIGNYDDHHPIPAEVRLLVEVSDATLATDRGSKRTAYARESIAEYWIVNLVNRRLEVYRNPAFVTGEHIYKFTQTLFDGDTVSPLFAPEAVIAVADLFPPAPAPAAEAPG